MLWGQFRRASSYGGFMKVMLAIDGGGSRTRAGLYDAAGTLLAEADGGPANPVDVGVDRCVEVVAALGNSLRGTGDSRVAIDTVAAGIAGLRHDTIRAQVAAGLARALPARRVIASDDLLPLLLANVPTGPGVVVVAGTGSCALGRTADGALLRVGGGGPIIGDRGSGYRIAVSALRGIALDMEHGESKSKLAAALSAAAGLDRFDAFSEWTATAHRADIARLATTVCELAEQGDSMALACLEEQAGELAEDVAALCGRLGHAEAVPVALHGGVFTHSASYTRTFSERLTSLVPGASVGPAGTHGHAAAAALGRVEGPLPEGAFELIVETTPEAKSRPTSAPTAGLFTEQHLDTERPLDRLGAQEISEAMSREDARAAKAVANAAPSIAQAIQAAADAFAEGGRLIYLGAGTSGRLGVLDASECPPTFGVSPGQVIGLMAGGEDALRNSIEGAEDDANQAVADLNALSPALNAKDFVVGITASGRTPYVIAALEEAARKGCTTAMVCCNEVGSGLASIVIALDTGAEVLAGSTRLKAGTATKLVLNQISTGAMALSGRVYDGYMVGVRAANDKLRERAAGIIMKLTGLAEQDASRLLVEAHGEVTVAVLMTRAGLGVDEAVACLETSGGSLRAALETL